MAKMTLELLVSQLQLAYGGALRSVVLYGSAAREGAPPERNLNVLVVVDHLSMELLARQAAIAAAWTEAGNPPLLTMTTDEWRGSADVFPIEYADLLDAHRVIHGTLPLEGVTVTKADLRLHLEHEAMGKLLRLRRGILAAGTEPARQLDLLAESVPAFIVLFRALLRVHGDPLPADVEGVCAAAALRAGFEGESFARALKHARGGERIPAVEAGSVLAAYLAGATQLAHHIDRLGVT